MNLDSIASHMGSQVTRAANNADASMKSDLANNPEEFSTVPPCSMQKGGVSDQPPAKSMRTGVVTQTTWSCRIAAGRGLPTGYLRTP